MKNKDVVKVFSILLISIFLISMVAAFEFDNVVDYSEDKLSVDINNCDLWVGACLNEGDEIGTVTLTSHKNVDDIIRVNSGEEVPTLIYKLDFMEIYENGFGETKFINRRTGKEVQRNYYYAEIIEPVCEDILDKNGTTYESCSRITYKKIETTEIKKEVYDIALITEVRKGDYIDAYITFAGKELKEHAEFAEGDSIGWFDTGSTDDDATGLCGNGTDIWVVDSLDLEVYHYTLSEDGLNGTFVDQFDISSAVGDTNSQGCYYSPTTDYLYTASLTISSTFVWDRNGTAISSHTNNVNAAGIRAMSGNATSLFYTNIVDDDIYAKSYTGAAQFNFDVAGAGSDIGTGLSYTTNLGFWLADEDDGKMYRFDTNGSANTNWDFNATGTGVRGVYYNTDNDYIYTVTSLGNGFFIYSSGIIPGPTITLNSPIEYFNTTSNSITFNWTVEDDIQVDNSTLYINGILNQTFIHGTSDSTNEQVIIDVDDGTHTWNINATDNENQVTNSGERNFTIDSILPNITINSPLALETYGFDGKIELLNWTVVEDNLDSMWYDYNGTNITVSGLQNVTNLTIEGVNNTNLTFYANDTIGNMNSLFWQWEYVIYELNQTFNPIVIELSDESFELFVQSSSTITQALLNYNGTDYISNILSTGGGVYQITTNLQIPSFDAVTNVTFFYNLSNTDLSNVLSSNQTQEIRILNIGNCTAYSNLIMNLSLFDERTLEPIIGTIEFDLEILNSGDGSVLSEVSTSFTNITNTSVCSDINLTEGSYLYNTEIRYFSSIDNGTSFTHVPEFYHIQEAQTSGLPQTINLYDLNINESTEFTVFYRDNDYISRENVLFQIQRKYVDEGLFRVIEIPITSSEGSAVSHFDLDNYKYRITVTENGVVLNTFNNPAIRCESELSGICEVHLKGVAPTPQVEFVSQTTNFFYTVDQTNNSVIIDFSIPSGESLPVNILMNQTSAFADPIIICNQTILSSAGQIECFVNASIGDSVVMIDISSNNQPKGLLKATFQEDLNSSFLLNNYFVAAIILITLVLMFISSPALMIVASVFGLIFLGLVFILKSNTIGLALGAIGWILVSSIIISHKLNQQAET